MPFGVSFGVSLSLPFGMREREFALSSAAQAIDVSWIDEFVDRIRPYVFVRAADNLIIKRPNQAQKLNASGVAILEELLRGGEVQLMPWLLVHIGKALGPDLHDAAPG